MHDPITTIIRRRVTKKVRNQMMLCSHLTHLSSASALPCETEQLQIAFFT